MGSMSSGLVGQRKQLGGDQAISRLKNDGDIGRIKSALSQAAFMKYKQNPGYSKTSNYNETVRANNRRIDQGKQVKRLPRGKVAAKQWRRVNTKQAPK